MNLSADLVKIKKRIENYAAQSSLDFFPVIFEILPYEQINEIASKGGFPIRYPHWRFGMEYEHMSKSFRYGLQKIYEMVINNNPCYAYLLEGNNLVDQKLVMAHVYAHCDFFKNNKYFSKTNRKMMDEMANHAIRINKYIDQYGLTEVEEFIDRCLSLENLIDYNAPFIKRKSDAFKQELHIDKKQVKRLKSKKYMDKYINPPDFLDEQERKIAEDNKKTILFPEQPERDILMFLLEYAPLKDWQRDILAIIREEAYYFAPQAQTKIMNEGWASYWHSKLMTTKILTDAEFIDYADHHSGTVHMAFGQINPYKIGLELFRNIEDRWNKGKFGKEYDACDSYVEKKNWDKKLGQGPDKIFEVRQNYNDINFIDAFLTEEFCNAYRLFTYKYNPNTKRYEIGSRDFEKIKKQLLFSLTNIGQPMISVENANFENRAALLLNHQSETMGLDIDYAKRTLENVFSIWSRPVYIKTEIEDKPFLLSFDGQNHKTQPV